MKTLEKTTTAHLLDTSLEGLHQQSMEWLEDIAFWRDESAFLYALEMKKTLKSVPVGAKQTLQKIDEELIKISGGDLDALYDAVEKHEHYLDKLLDVGHNDEADYREKHKEIAEQVMKFEKRLRTLKTTIFNFVKEHKVKIQDASGK